MAESGNVDKQMKSDDLKPADYSETVQIGRLVSSIRGRDSGRHYLVVGIESDSLVRVADGEGRKVDNPKRKNVKHLKFYEIVAGILSEKAQSGRRVTNEDVRKELKSLVEIL